MCLGLHFIRYPSVLETYCDANWVSVNWVSEVTSTSGHLFTLAGRAVSWKSSKQSCNAKSTMESEFLALALARLEAQWLRNLLFDILLWEKSMPSICLHCYSKAVIAKTQSEIYNFKS